jgi:hypothetical protein
MPADMFLVPIRIKGEDAPISGDAFDFTNEPTVSEGRPINDCESKVYMQTRLLGDGAAPQLTSEPTAPAPTGYEIREHVEFTYQKIVWDSDGSTDDLAVDPTNPNAEYSGFQIVKLLDASTPISDGTSNTLMVGEILPGTTGARVPPHTPEWTDFNSVDPGLLLPYTDFDIA